MRFSYVKDACLSDSFDKDRDRYTWDESHCEKMYVHFEPWMLLSHRGCRSQSLASSLEDSSPPLATSPR